MLDDLDKGCNEMMMGLSTNAMIPVLGFLAFH